MILSVVVLFIIIQSSLFCYIDPGTGSLLFSALFGIIGTLFFLSKALLIKLKTFSFADKINKKENISKAKIIIYGEDKRYYNVFKPIKFYRSRYLFNDNSEFRFISIKAL